MPHHGAGDKGEHRGQARKGSGGSPRKEGTMQPGKVSSNAVPADQPRGGASLDAGAAAGNVDKIRDILFGSQMKDYETRFSRLEETLLSHTAELRESTKKRIDGLEAYLKKEVEALQMRLKNEREERSEAVKQATREMNDLGDALGRKLREMQDHHSESEHGLRDQILQQSQELLEEIRTRQTELSSLLDRRIQELSSAKTDRAALGALLTEMAMRLTDEFHLPGTEA